MYTNNKKYDNQLNLAGSQKLIPVVFQGDSRRALQDFPDGVKNDLGYALYRVQLGQTPPELIVVMTICRPR